LAKCSSSTCKDKTDISHRRIICIWLESLVPNIHVVFFYETTNIELKCIASVCKTKVHIYIKKINTLMNDNLRSVPWHYEVQPFCAGQSQLRSDSDIYITKFLISYSNFLHINTADGCNEKCQLFSKK
jgi:hypothetical protein